ncbi:hypothetical protein IU433_14615, partial [Nocardia puris]|nr:hypothetical protein [Nocardia puris]
MNGRRGVRPMVGALPLAIAVACAGTALADPAPVQPGVTTPSAPAPAPTPEQPGVAAPNQDNLTGPGPSDDAPVQHLRPQQRPAPSPSAPPPPPIAVEDLHLPEPVEPVAPIAPPPRTLRVGEFSTPVPDEVPDDLLGGVNGTAADVEAFIATQGRSVGINPSRSDKIAAATAAGAVGGALAGAAIAGVPAAVVGGVAGGAL